MISHDERKRNSKLLIEAAEQCNLGEIERLIPISYPQTQDNAALTWSVNKNHVEGVKRLAPVCEVGIALSVAAEWGRVDCLRVLIEFATPQDIIFAAGDAAYEGKMEDLQFLLEHCDAKNSESFPLQMAAIAKREDIVTFLIPLSNPLDALKELGEEYNNEEAVNFLQEILARHQKTTIEQSLDTPTERTHVRKI